MTDNEVYIAIRHQMLAQMNNIGLTIPVVAGFQSTKQGREDRFVMFFPINEAGHGWQARNYQVTGTDANHKETQLVEKTLQVQGLVSDASELTATDLTATVRMIVNSLPFVDEL
ncbi:phage related-protein, partial [bacteria symbiont BFo2 of Frankliniella occidentalis]